MPKAKQSSMRVYRSSNTSIKEDEVVDERIIASAIQPAAATSPSHNLPHRRYPQRQHHMPARDKGFAVTWRRIKNSDICDIAFNLDLICGLLV